MLQAVGLRRSYGSVDAVRDVTVTVPSGAMFGLLGPNGAGKTTTMRMILGIVPPDAGTIRFDGRPVDARSRRRFGYLPEERGLYGKLRVNEQIAYFARLHGMRDADAAREATRWIERLDLAANAKRSCSELSKGNQQKVQLACAAAHHPSLLVLDEPFSGLDPVNAETFATILRELQAAGTTLILSSHQMWQLERLCTDFCIISGGRTRAAGTLAELGASFATRVLRVAPQNAALRAVALSLAGVMERPSDDGVMAFDVPRDLDLGDALRRMIAVSDVTAFERLAPSLDAIYRRAIDAGYA